MSKTLKTRPMHVRMADGEFPAKAVHNHDDGPCDLLPLRSLKTEPQDGLRCRWEPGFDGRNKDVRPLRSGREVLEHESRVRRTQERLDSRNMMLLFNSTHDLKAIEEFDYATTDVRFV